MKLYELAHSRAGDKGDTSILSVIAYRREDYPFICRAVTAERVAAHLANIVKGDVTRYLVPRLHALQFVCTSALTGGVTTSLSVDTHGKTLSSALLELELDLPDEDRRSGQPQTSPV